VETWRGRRRGRREEEEEEEDGVLSKVSAVKERRRKS